MQWQEVTKSEFDHEKSGLNFIKENFPQNMGYVAWSNFTFDGGGTSNEVDLLIAGPSGVFLIDLKAHPGKLSINNPDWRMVEQNGRYRVVHHNNPRRLAETKAKRLKSVLSRMGRGRIPFIEGMICFTDESADLSSINPSITYGICGTTQKNNAPCIIESILSPNKCGLSIAGTPNPSGLVGEFATRFDKLGIGKLNFSRTIGDWILESKLESVDESEEWVVRHKDRDETARARCYVFSNETDNAREEYLTLRARREHKVLRKIKHPSIELPIDLVEDGERGPAIILDDDFKTTSLTNLVGQQGPSNLEDIKVLLFNIAECIQHSHSRTCTHRSLSPDCIFVSEDNSIEIRNWTNASTSLNSTTHDHITTEITGAYQSPELTTKKDIVDPASDIFSLGCIAYFLSTGEHPPTRENGFCRVTSHGIDAEEKISKLSDELAKIILRSTINDRNDRLATATDFIDLLTQKLKIEPAQEVIDIENSNIEIMRRLGSGSSGVGYECVHEGQSRVLKVAHDEISDVLIEREAEVLKKLNHPAIVTFYDVIRWKNRSAIVMESAGSTTLGEMLRHKIKLSEVNKNMLIENLFSIAIYLEDLKIIHGDLHPDHIGVASYPHDISIKLFDFSLMSSGSAIPCSLAYTDPFFSNRNAAPDRAADIYSIAAIAYAIKCNEPPRWGDGQCDPATDSSIQLQLNESLDEDDTQFFINCFDRELSNRPQTALKLMHEWQNILESKNRTLNKSEESKKDSKESEQSPQQEESPSCPECGNDMVIRRRRRDNNPFWGCSAFPSCRGTQNVDESFREKDDSPSLTSATPPKSLTTIDLTIQTGLENYFSYPMSFASGRRNEIYNEKINNAPYQSFLMLQPETEAFLHSPAYQNTISIAEKIITRGRVAPLSPQLENAVIKLISDNDAPAGNRITPNFLKTLSFDSIEEQRFVEEYLVPALGTDRLSCISAQVNLSALTQHQEDFVRGERVDLVVTDGKKVKIVIEIDGEQHEESVVQDENRDSRLQNAGWKVIRIPTTTLNSRNHPAILEALEAISLCEPDKPATVEDDVLTRCKQVQIVLLDILRSNAIGTEISVNINWPDWGENINGNVLTKLVLTDFNNLIQDSADLYETSYSQFSNSSTAEHIIEFQDFDEDDIGARWIIRDIHIPGIYRLKTRTPQSCPPSSANADALRNFLERIYGFSEFREGQLEALQRGVAGKDSIVLLPTGAGKTVVFQLASLLRPGPGLIIDPLIALIDDQMDNLNRHGITNAGCITGNTHQDERNFVMRALGEGSLLFTYISPERFQIADFRNSLHELAVSMPISSVAIDEAHCVSEWGHDFRTAYLNISTTVRNLCSHRGIEPPILALTGTASKAVLRDVRRELEIRGDDAIITPKTFERKELHFRFIQCDSAQKSSTLKSVLKQISESYNQDVRRFYSPKGSKSNCGLIFTPHTNASYGVVEAAKAARELTGVDVGVYSGGKPKIFQGSDQSWNAEKSATARKFKNNEITVLATTKAFGMGIDKPNIRTTTHLNIPPSVEALYQEAGRAGRDRKDSMCWVILSDERAQMDERLLDPNTSIEQLNEIVHKELKYKENDDIARQLWFHTNAFQGIEEEVNSIKEVLGLLGALDQPKIIEIPYERSDKGRVEKAVHRLTTVGVVTDYTVNYASDVIRAEVSGAQRDRVINTLKKYVSNYEKRPAIEAANQLSQLDEEMPLFDFITEAARVVTAFIYKHVEKSRRRALATTYDICKIGLNDSKEAEKMMLNYLQVSKFEVDVEDLCDPNKVGDKTPHELMDRTLEAAGLIENPEDAKLLFGTTTRSLNSYPNNPWLLMLLSIVECLQEKPDLSNIENNAKASWAVSSSDFKIKEIVSILNKVNEIVSFNASNEALLKLGCGVLDGIAKNRSEAIARDLAHTLLEEQNIASVGKYYLTRKLNDKIDKLL